MYAPASRRRQGQALRALRNRDTAGRGRALDGAGSEGMPFCLTKGMNRKVRLGRSSATAAPLPLHILYPPPICARQALAVGYK